MQTRKYTMLANLLVVQILEGNKTIEDVKIAELREAVEEILNNDDLLVKLYATRVIEGLESIETTPESIRGKVEDFLGKQSTSVILLVSDILDGVKKLSDVPEALRPEVEAELERFVGKPISQEN